MTYGKTRKMERRADFKEGKGYIYIELASWRGSCHGDRAQASERSVCWEKGRAWADRGECALGANGSSPVTLFPHAHGSAVNKVAQLSPDKHWVTSLENRPPGVGARDRIRAGYLSQVASLTPNASETRKQRKWNRLSFKLKSFHAEKWGFFFVKPDTLHLRG